MSDTKHTYPSMYPVGAHWSTDEAWLILDHIKPGIIPDDVRSYLVGAIASALMKYAIEGRPEK